ncbi:MAG: metallophosphoesterase [Micrococcales bacterium]|nr:metallophosphoesterase [Micrococcales bacterium]
MLIAALGDVHGQWREAVTLVEWACAEAGVAASDLAAVFQVGDAEALRDETQVAQVPGPAKYRRLGDFPRVLDGTVVVPAPLFFVAGNHEPFAALDADGGLVAGHGRWGPDVTYLGRAGAVTVAGLRVGFLSGIARETTASPSPKARSRDQRAAAYYSTEELASTRRATQQGRFDVLITHNWPSGLDSARTRHQGDPNLRDLIVRSRPALSLHGHMHVAHREQIGGTEVACLAKVGFRYANPLDAVGIWQIAPGETPARRLV